MNSGETSESMKIKEIPISILLPQRAPFIMVDRLVDFDRMHTTTEFLVREDCLFVKNGELETKGMVENVAQTCAARMGYINYIAQKNVKLGYIGAIRHMTFLRCPKVGELLTTSIVVREEVFRMTLVYAEIRVGDEVISTAEMKIALSEIDAEDV